MDRPTDPSQSPLLDLDVLEIDSVPAFIIKISVATIPFEIMYANEAFRAHGLRDSVSSEEREAFTFRAWAQAVAQSKESRHDFAGCTWSGEVAGKTSALKLIKATQFKLDTNAVDEHQPLKGDAKVKTGVSIYERPEDDATRDRQTVSSSSLDARLESLQTMMEMSDVGVFEYNVDGILLHANEAFYRLRSVIRIRCFASLIMCSSYSRGEAGATEYAFMESIYPDDRDKIMSVWNTLAQGIPLTFEMRWKPRAGTNDIAQWTLTTCIPVLDEKKNVVGIGGNIIDINAQKRSHEATEARVEALEQARLSELKFANFAQLSPIAIYIYDTEKGKCYHSHRLFSSYLRHVRYAIRQ
jgi:PAS domain-containing protein